MNEERLIDLESRNAHQEVAIEELQDVVYKQQAAIDALEKSLKLLRERFEANFTGAGDIGPGNDKPPHY